MFKQAVICQMFKTACKVPVNSPFISKAAEVRKLGGGRWG